MKEIPQTHRHGRLGGMCGLPRGVAGTRRESFASRAIITNIAPDARLRRRQRASALGE